MLVLAPAPVFHAEGWVAPLKPASSLKSCAPSVAWSAAGTKTQLRVPRDTLFSQT